MANGEYDSYNKVENIILTNEKGNIGKITSDVMIGGQPSFEIDGATGNASFQGISLPIGFVYFRLPGQPAPNTIFGGTWQDISSQYAGLFFRIHGGTAANFEGQQFDSNNRIIPQNESVKEHMHGYFKPDDAEELASKVEAGDIQLKAVKTISYNGETINYGGTETRPSNFTIRVYKRTD